MRACLPLLFLVACADWVAPIDSGSPDCLTDEDCTAETRCHEGRCLERSLSCSINGRLEAGEDCDDGNNDDLDGCTGACVLARCGDGLQRLDLELGESGYEACDDGNSSNTDGCSNNCLATRCGDGILRNDLGPEAEGYEACDDGNPVDGDACTNACQIARCGDEVLRQLDANGQVLAEPHSDYEACDDGNDDPLDACTDLCQRARCGDGLNRAAGDGGEECDDGNEADGDGCSSACLSEICGNNRLDADEACDDGNQVDGDDCTNDCQVARCGDGVQGPGEDCDDGNGEDGDGCSGLCLEESCGNSRLDGEEACDDGNDNNADDCSNTCQIARCGDGHLRDGVEACDDGNEQGGDGCSADCAPEYCGNGRVERGEACDDGNDNDDDDCANTCGVGFVDVDVTDGHGCGVHLSGDLRCWGTNDDGQTGIAGTVLVTEPTLVPGIETAVQVSLSHQSSCVLLENGIVKCWGKGFNEPGEAPATLGSPETPMSSLQLTTDIYVCSWNCAAGPQVERDYSTTVYGIDAAGAAYELQGNEVQALPDMAVVRKIAGSSAYRCRLDENGDELCYGHSCALNEDGGIFCWGANMVGQLGNNSTVDSEAPVAVLRPDGQAALSGATDLSVGWQGSCAIGAEGQVICWGNHFGLSTSNWAPARAGVQGEVGPPQVVDFLGPMERIWLRSNYWDTHLFVRNEAGQSLLYDAREDPEEVRVIPGLQGLRDLGLGDRSVAPPAVDGLNRYGLLNKSLQCALDEANDLFCWGATETGAVGLGKTPVKTRPYRVPNLLPVVKVVAGDRHSCALQANGRVRCWGWDLNGQRGDGVFMDPISFPGFQYDPPTPRHHRPSPLDLQEIGDETLTRLWSWRDSGCVGTEESQYWCWGFPYFWVLPRAVDGLQGLDQLTMAGRSFPRACGLSPAGRPRCTPAGDFHQPATDFEDFGDGFVQLTGDGQAGTPWILLCGLHQDGSVWCWRSPDWILPLWPGGLARVEGLPSAREIQAGGRLLCAITEEDQVICWYDCGGGRCGVDVENNPENQQLQALEDLPSPPVQLALGGLMGPTCVRLENGALHCWGGNSDGGLGDGTRISRWQHAPVDELPPVVDVSAGVAHVCAVDADGALYCWGKNIFNQLGDGYNSDGVERPTRVTGY